MEILALFAEESRVDFQIVFKNNICKLFFYVTTFLHLHFQDNEDFLWASNSHNFCQRTGILLV